jgi:hypothetical protein
MYKFLIGLSLLFIAPCGVSQEVQTKKKKTSFSKQLQASTKEQIIQLKNGALLVRLKTRTNAITALRKIGKNVQADVVEKQQAEFNLNIIDAFKKNFNFCPTYFFYSDYSDNIKEKQFDKVTFLNDSLRPDPTIKFDAKGFLIAEFGTVEQDTAKYYSYNSTEADGNFSVKRVDHYNGSPSFSYDGLIIRSDKFIQLSHPFPYFVRTRDPRPKKKKLEKVVKTMNKNLASFYNANK